MHFCRGTPRQDVPRDIYSDAAMFDDVFDKKGQLLLSRNTPKITAPLNSLGYSRYVRRYSSQNKSDIIFCMYIVFMTLTVASYS